MEDNRKDTPKSVETKPDTETISPSDFEFGSLTPSCPSQDPFSENSPADHLFLNGRLLPHAFPVSKMMTRSVSRTTSENTFRSNSTSSRSSDSSSPTSSTPRTSITGVSKVTSPRSEEIVSLRSGICLRNKYYQNQHKPSSLISDVKKKPPTNKMSYLPQCKKKKATEIVTAQLYGSYSRQWQHITPVFKREGSVKSNGGGIKVGGRKKKTARKTKMKKKKKKAEKRSGISKLMKWWKRILKAVVFACRECHAMGPQILVTDDIVDVNKKIIKCP